MLLNAERKLLIDDTINLGTILKLIKTTTIQIKNILGFNQYKKTTIIRHQVELREFEIYFSDVSFDFYLNKSLITKKMCKCVI